MLKNSSAIFLVLFFLPTGCLEKQSLKKVTFPSVDYFAKEAQRIVDENYVRDFKLMFEQNVRRKYDQMQDSSLLKYSLWTTGAAAMVCYGNQSLISDPYIQSLCTTTGGIVLLASLIFNSLATMVIVPTPYSNPLPPVPTHTIATITDWLKTKIHDDISKKYAIEITGNFHLGLTGWSTTDQEKYTMCIQNTLAHLKKKK